MTIERGQHELDSEDFIELTEKLVAITREKSIHQRQQDGDQTVSQVMPSTTYNLSVVIPTRNERDNILPLLDALENALHDLHVEFIFVDDSDDDTPAIIEDAARSMDSYSLHIKLEHRLAGEARAGGLATAVVHGMNKAQAEYIAVLDADLQHPPELLRAFYYQAVAQDMDLVLASRYIKGGGYQGLDGVGRLFISVGMKWLAKLLFPEQLLRISDPLGGFFLMRSSLLTDISLRPIGYKILLEVLIRCPWQQVLEVPYHFQARAHGQSKANMKQGMMALKHMKRLWFEVPTAGRIWKISLMFLLNALIALTLFVVNRSFPWVLASLGTIIFSVMALLDFVIFNRFIFPTPTTTSDVAPSTHTLTFLQDIEAAGLPSAISAAIPIEDLETDTSLSIPPAIIAVEEIETVEIPSTPSAIIAGEEIENVETPSTTPAVMSDEHLEIEMFQLAAPVVTSVEDVPATEPVEELEAVKQLTAAPATEPIEDLEAVEKSTEVPATTPIEDLETIELSSTIPAIIPDEELEAVEQPSTTPVIMRDEEFEAVELPSTPLLTIPIEDLEAIKGLELPELASAAPETISTDDIETAKLPATILRARPTKEQKAARSRLAALVGTSLFERMQKKYEKILLIVTIAVITLTVGWIGYALPGALLVIAALFIGTTVVFMKKVNREQAITMLLSIGVGVATIDYVTWRFVVTNWSGWWIAVPLLFAETLGALHTLGFQFTVWPWSPPKVENSEDPTQHPIFVFIPTVNEGPEILRPTLQGIMAARDKYLARYPHGQVTIVVCNDGRVANAENWEETEDLAKELGVCCITRTKKGGAKAGNIENARQQLQATGDALLVIFDADQVAKPDFLLKTIPPFGDPKMGWVQTGQYYANLDNPVSRWADDQQSMFYNLLCPGKAALNAAFICGTNVVLRAAALDEIGGLPQDSVTEDFAASIALHPTWRSVYLTDVLATGLGPLDVPSYLKQQNRWAMGTLGVFRTHWREIFLPSKHGLSIGQRVQYFLACTHYLCGLRDLIYLLSPILFIFTGIPAVGGATLSEYLWHFLPYGLLSATAMWYSSRSLTGLRGIIIGFGSFPVLISSLLSVILKRKVGFSVTSKQRDGKRSLNYLGVYLFSLLFCIICIIWATQIKGQQQVSLFISAMWVVYSIVMLGSFLWLNFKDFRFHAAVLQSGSQNETVANQSYPAKLAKRKRGLQPLWNVGLAALVAGPILASSSLGSLTFSAIHSSSTPFVISQEKIVAPYVGLSLPVQLLTKEPPVLAQDLNTQFSVIGRTQDVHDFFDKSWADQLAAHNARPWITLQFGVFGANGKPPLDANLPAIINGLQDQNLIRWAEDIRDYGKPVYLTILQHADRNWSLSSGVANGGIPQDVPKAWMHVQSVFRSVGANNVAWVWAPADPIDDQAYAPPASTINAVLQSFINYPGTKWGDPEKVLQDLGQRYPSKPIFVEASADGPATLKAAWLTSLGQAVNNDPQVYALLYHEGGPGLKLTSAQIKSWSLASDSDSLAAMRRIVVILHDKAIAHAGKQSPSLG